MHDALVAIAKSWGLFYMIGISVIVLAWVYRPSNRQRFDRAAGSIIDVEDRPADPTSDGVSDTPPAGAPADTSGTRP